MENLNKTSAPEYLITNKIQLQTSVLKELIKYAKDSPLPCVTGHLFGSDSEDCLKVENALCVIDKNVNLQDETNNTVK